MIHFINRILSWFYGITIKKEPIDIFQSHCIELASRQINMYNISTSYTKKFYSRDIVDSISFMEYLLEKDFTEDYINDLLTYTPIKTSYIEWYSDNSRMIDKDKLNDWLYLAVELHKVYDKYIPNKSGKGYSNSMKLKPYIINIEEIVTDLLELTNSNK